MKNESNRELADGITKLNQRLKYQTPTRPPVEMIRKLGEALRFVTNHPLKITKINIDKF